MDLAARDVDDRAPRATRLASVENHVHEIGDRIEVPNSASAGLAADIRTGRSDRRDLGQQLQCEFVVGNANPDLLAPGGEHVGNHRPPLDENGDWARKELVHELSFEVGGVGILQGGLDVRDRERDRFVPTPAFRLEDALDRVGIERVGTQSVDRLGRVDDQFARADRVGGVGDVRHR